MRRNLWTALLPLLLSGCAYAAPVQAATVLAKPVLAKPVLARAAALPTAAEVGAMLLTASDVPPGYAPTAAGTADDGKPNVAASINGCGVSDTGPAVPHADGAAVFNNGLVTYLAEGLRVSTAADAARAVRAVRTASRDCGFGTLGAAAPLAFPALGDESAAMRSSAQTGIIGAVVTDVVAIRYQDTLILLTHTGLGEPVPATLQSIARAALAKVAANR